MVREKSLVKPKSKKPLIITLVAVAVLALAGGVYYYLAHREKPVFLSDAEYLIDVESWEKSGAPSVIWAFRADSKGELTTNKSNYYPTSWSLEGGKLQISTSWLYELNDEFEFSLNRVEKSFTVKNLSDDTESTFLPLGTQESTSADDASDASDSAPSPESQE